MCYVLCVMCYVLCVIVYDVCYVLCVMCYVLLYMMCVMCNIGWVGVEVGVGREGRIEGRGGIGEGE